MKHWSKKWCICLCEILGDVSCGRVFVNTTRYQERCCGANDWTRESLIPRVYDVMVGRECDEGIKSAQFCREKDGSPSGDRLCLISEDVGKVSSDKRRRGVDRNQPTYRYLCLLFNVMMAEITSFLVVLFDVVVNVLQGVNAFPHPYPLDEECPRPLEHIYSLRRPQAFWSLLAWPWVRFCS